MMQTAEDHEGGSNAYDMSGNSSAEEEEEELIRQRDEEDDQLISKVVDIEREKYDVATVEVLISSRQLASSADHLERWKLPTVIGLDGNLIHKRKIVVSRINKERSLSSSFGLWRHL